MSHKFLRGQLLLDSGSLYGSFFYRTVVLVCTHDEDGAFGLILNRDSGMKVGEALPNAKLPDSVKALPLFIGGPVQPGVLSYLVTDEFLPDANVMPGVSVGHSLEELIDLASYAPPTRKIRVFAGYSGWSPGQLENEIKHKAWLVHPASKELIFHPKPEDLWRLILCKKGPVYRIIALAPENPSVN